MKSAIATVYLIHFQEKFKNTQHYLGYTTRFKTRMKHHKSGTGARLLRAVKLANILWLVVRTWEGDKKFERKLKNYKKSRLLCPVCRKEKHLRLVQSKLFGAYLIAVKTCKKLPIDK